ncbi:hypothetical protein E2562_010256 [Oryza meyeriana var. granulata]|uniref:RRM domain-containing protein n=1 Tax=Oryza meyeriana var. granulata TaxID=110450 RepID=A0A6G1EJS7_9ORYZ|nr:hypothetical protein E2562_010256 [Oryza meyeriana var. granulata]
MARARAVSMAPRLTGDGNGTDLGMLVRRRQRRGWQAAAMTTAPSLVCLCSGVSSLPCAIDDRSLEASFSPYGKILESKVQIKYDAGINLQSLASGMAKASLVTCFAILRDPKLLKQHD